MVPRNLTHSNLWRGIDRLAAKHGLSTSGLALRAGLDATTFGRSKRISPDGKPRWPSTETIAKVLTVTGEPLAGFISMLGPPTKSRPRRRHTRTG
jgi:phage repressor protein C with HTH and peptisase S24 domain